MWDGVKLHDLGTLGGDHSEGRAINSKGWVGGIAFTDKDLQHAVIWVHGRARDLGTFGGTRSAALAINNAGQATGSANLQGDTVERAFFWGGSRLRDLGTLGGTHSVGQDINNAGWITGLSNRVGATKFRAFVWDGAKMRDLGTLGGTISAGVGINDSGFVAGTASLAGDAEEHAFLWDGSTMRDLGTLGGRFSYGRFINDSGVVAGESTLPGDLVTHAFIWKSKIRDLGTLGGSRSEARGINASGQVTGFSTTRLVVKHAFLWANNQMYDLNDLIDPTDPLKAAVTLHEGQDINDFGQIVAIGQIDGRTHTFVASPTDYRYFNISFPTPPSEWTLGRSVSAQITLKDVVSGMVISDMEAAALLTDPCRVKFSLSGAQSIAPVCMNYNPSTNRFSFNWKLASTGVGRVTVAIDVVYPNSSTTMIRRTRNVEISNWTIRLRRLLSLQDIG
jgi:probable HAF family extracellular repeat protein